MQDKTPDVVLAVAPYMDELLRLRKDIYRLRMEKFPRNQTIAELIEGTPLEIKASHMSGLWDYTMRLRHFPTGGHGFESYEAAFRDALKRLSEMDFARDDDEDDE